MNKMKRKNYYSVVVAGKVQPDDDIQDFENPKFGRYWWFWLPRIQWNGGKFRKEENVDVSLVWLCVSLNFTSYANMRWR